MDILALLQCLQPTVTKTTLRQCSRIVLAMLVMTGRVTMLGLSRGAGTGSSYRTIQRFCATALPFQSLPRSRPFMPANTIRLSGCCNTKLTRNCVASNRKTAAKACALS